MWGKRVSYTDFSVYRSGFFLCKKFNISRRRLNRVLMAGHFSAHVFFVRKLSQLSLFFFLFFFSPGSFTAGTSSVYINRTFMPGINTPSSWYTVCMLRLFFSCLRNIWRALHGIRQPDNSSFVRFFFHAHEGAFDEGTRRQVVQRVLRVLYVCTQRYDCYISCRVV